MNPLMMAGAGLAEHTRPDTAWCPSCARHVPASHMRQHEGGGRWVDLPECKACLIRKKRA